jgi:hypothetical protein
MNFVRRYVAAIPDGNTRFSENGHTVTNEMLEEAYNWINVLI